MIETFAQPETIHLSQLYSCERGGGGEAYRMRWQDNIWVVPPPQTHTVKKTTSRVVENIIWRAYVAVSLMDRAKVIAPRSPDEHRWLLWTHIEHLSLLHKTNLW